MTKAERSWILYDCANSAQTLIITATILPAYFKKVVAADMPLVDSTSYWSLANSVAMILVAVLSPILGALADHRGYKKRLFVVFFLIGIVATLGLATVTKGMWIECLALFCVSTVGFYGAVVFYDSFLVDVASKERMDWVSASGFAWGYIASTIPFIASILLINYWQPLGFSSKTVPTRISFVITAAWWAVLTIPMLMHVKQVHFRPDHDNPLKESLLRLKSTLAEIPKYRALFLFLIAYFLYIDGVHTIYKMATPFGIDIGLKEERLLVIFLVTQIVAFPCAILFGWLARFVGAKRMVIVGIAVYFVVVTLAYFIRTEAHFWALALLIAFAQGGIQSLSRSMFAKLVPPQDSARFFGFYDIFGKFAAILGPVMVAGVGRYYGDTRMGLFSLIVLFFLGGGLLLFVRDPTPSQSTSGA